MEIFQHLMSSFLQVGEKILDSIENGIDYARFQLELQEELNKLGKEICREVLEAMDEFIKKHPGERKGWTVERQGEPKSILSPFGLVEYRRCYYKNKARKEYAHLVDRMAGYGPHARVDAALKSNLVDMSAELSYRKSGKELARNASELEVSGQTVLNAIRSFDSKKVLLKENQGPKRKVKVLYIEADEDHVATQDGKNIEVRLVYVHEGRTGVGKRKALKNARHFSGLYKDVEDLWMEVQEYIWDYYEADEIKHIFVSGDGAGWIRSGASLLSKAIFVLDKFHIRKYILTVAGPDKMMQQRLWRSVHQCNKEELAETIKSAYQEAQTQSRRKSIRDCLRYFMRGWDGVEAYKKYPEYALGCSAEGHVSHILSARLSSRPMGWSKKGADQMARLRAIKANGLSIREEFLSDCTGTLNIIKICKLKVQQARETLKTAPFEQLDNIPLLNGHTGPFKSFLKAVCHPA